MATQKTYNLEDRLITLACICLDVCELLPISKAGQNLEYPFKKCYCCSAHLRRSSISKSPADFLHKMKLVLKEIRETRVNLKIIEQKPMIKHQKVDLALDEAGQLMAIFLKSIETTKNNHPVKQKNSNLPVKTS